MTTEPAATATPLSDRLRRWTFRDGSPRDVGGHLVHTLLDLPVALVSCIVTLTLGLLALGLLVVYPVALPFVLAWVAGVRGLGAMERRRAGALLGYTVTSPPPLPTDGSWHQRLWAAARHPDTWRAAGFHLLRLPVAILTFTSVVAALALPVQLLLSAADLAIARIAFESVGGASLTLALVVLAVAVLPLIPRVVLAMGRFDAAMAAAMLGPSERSRLDGRVEQLSSSRSELVDIADQERRRIERDLHDGAGQQLVALAMTLGMAREKLADDPEAARSLIDEAHTDAKQALVGLREIVRGISPAILAERGLGAALSSVAGRSAVPVSLDVDVPERPHAAIEGIAYYVVCEGISNALRHSRASNIEVAVALTDDALHVRVTDDGRGGADPSRGTGLRGLAGRVKAVDGGFSMTSPPGGPTTLEVSLPAHVSDSTGGA